MRNNIKPPITQITAPPITRIHHRRNLRGRNRSAAARKVQGFGVIREL